MIRPLTAAAALALLLLPLAGCSPPTYTFQVAVRNETAEPVTLWLTKDGPPPENAWASPEQLARQTYDPSRPLPAYILPPGQAKGTPPLAGQFPQGVHPVLRVYRGALQKMSLILATPRNEPSVRLDLILQHAGLNEYVVRDDHGTLTATPPEKPWPVEARGGTDTRGPAGGSGAGGR